MSLVPATIRIDPSLPGTPPNPDKNPTNSFRRSHAATTPPIPRFHYIIHCCDGATGLRHRHIELHKTALWKPLSDSIPARSTPI